MATNSGIQWTDATWNPIAGCSPVSPGCTNCYAATMARRLEAMGQEKYAGTAERRGRVDVFTGVIRTDETALGLPLRWRKPKRIFVNSMSDLFRDDVPGRFIRLMFGVMSLCGQHTFQVLTKRAGRMSQWFADPANSLDACQAEVSTLDPAVLGDETPTGKSRVRDASAINGTYGPKVGDANHWPLPNVWLGVSVEDQQRADERIPHLLRTPAAVRFLSCEPLLGAVNLRFGASEGLPTEAEPCRERADLLHWIIVGGESGHGSRPCDVGWIRSIVSQCESAGVACFVKQLGSKPLWEGCDATACTELPRSLWRHPLLDRKGGDMAEWPEDIRVRQFPVTQATTA